MRLLCEFVSTHGMTPIFVNKYACADEDIRPVSLFIKVNSVEESAARQLYSMCIDIVSMIMDLFPRMKLLY